MKRRTLVFGSCAAAVMSGCKPDPNEANQKAIVGAVLIDGTGGPPISDSVVLTAGNRVRAAGTRANVPIPARAEKINGAGKFVIPGLIDLHVHLGSRAGPQFVTTEYTSQRVERNLNAYLYFGVTTVRSVGTERAGGFEVRQAERNGNMNTARLFTAGRGLTAPSGHPSQEIGAIARQPLSDSDAQRDMNELIAQQVDLIKIWVDDLHGTAPKIKPAILDVVLEKARNAGIPVVAHIATLSDTRYLLDNGASGFLHMIRDTEDIDAAFLARLRDLQAVFAPTLVRQELAWLYKEHPERLDDPDVARVEDADVIAAVRAAVPKLEPSDRGRQEFEIAKRNTRKLASAGVPIGVGSDGGSAMDFPGLMTHREIELLVESGLSPAEAIQAATRNGALALKKVDDLGTLEAGKRADLVMLSANPLEDVRNLRKIDRVMLDGQWIDRKTLPLK